MSTLGWFTNLIPDFLTDYHTLTADKFMAVRSFPMWEGARLHKMYNAWNAAPYGSKQFVPQIDYDPCLKYDEASAEYDSCEEASVRVSPPGWDGTTKIVHNGMDVFIPATDASSKPQTGKTGEQIMDEVQPRGTIVKPPTRAETLVKMQSAPSNTKYIVIGVIAVAGVLGALAYFNRAREE